MKSVLEVWHKRSSCWIFTGTLMIGLINTKVHFQRKATLGDLSHSLVAPSRSHTNVTGILMSKRDLIGYIIPKFFFFKKKKTEKLANPHNFGTHNFFIACANFYRCAILWNSVCLIPKRQAIECFQLGNVQEDLQSWAIFNLSCI